MQKDKINKKADKENTPVLIWIIAVLVAFISIGILAELLMEINATYESYFENIPIVALDNSRLSNENYSSSVFAQIGSYNQDIYYQLMIKNENDGKMKYIKLKADDAFIYEYATDSNEVPHIEIEWRIKTLFGVLIKEDASQINTDYIGFSDIIAKTNSISIHVPEGTVDRSMSINFE